jgi:hypothetical protein
VFLFVAEGELELHGEWRRVWGTEFHDWGRGKGAEKSAASAGSILFYNKGSARELEAE